MVGSDLHGGEGGVEAKRRDSELAPVKILQIEKSDSKFSLLVERRQRREEGEGCCEVQSVLVVCVAERREIRGLKFGSSQIA